MYRNVLLRWFKNRRKSAASSRLHPAWTAWRAQENIDAVRVTASSQEGGRSDGGEEGTSVLTEIIDFPGHARLRTLSAPYVEQAAAIVFLVDAADKAALKVAAE